MSAMVLIVDDEPGLADLVSTVLEQVGYATVIAFNGHEALGKMGQHRPDLVLLDMMMPVVDGAQVLQAMRSDAELAHVPVVVMTALPSALSDEVKEACATVLAKPFSPAALLSAVADALAGKT